MLKRKIPESGVVSNSKQFWLEIGQHRYIINTNALFDWYRDNMRRVWWNCSINKGTFAEIAIHLKQDQASSCSSLRLPFSRMSGLFTFFILIICYQIQNLPLVSSSSSNTLNGQHLKVIWVMWLISWTQSKCIDYYFYLASLEWKSPRTYGSAHGWRHRRYLCRTFQFHVSHKHAIDLLCCNFPDQFPLRYEMVRVTENRLEPQGKERGLFNYLWEKVESSQCSCD
jgi:hypothetical protein